MRILARDRLSSERLVFFNPHSGSAWRADRLLKAIDFLAVAPGTHVFSTEPGKIGAQVRRHMTPDVTQVFACGGDGTISDVAAALVDSPVALGVIPAGTTNVLAHEFGIPGDALRAAQALVSTTRTRPLHTWSAGAKHVVLGAGVGWDARVMFGVSREAKHKLGVIGVGIAGLGETARYDFPPLVVRGTDERGHDVELRGSSVLMCNVRYWAGGNAGIPMADPGDDVLDVVVLHPRSRAHLLTFWILMVLPGGRPLRLPGVTTARLRRLAVTCERGQEEAHLNGDPIAHTPLVVEPSGVVSVLVP